MGTYYAVLKQRHDILAFKVPISGHRFHRKSGVGYDLLSPQAGGPPALAFFMCLTTRIALDDAMTSANRRATIACTRLVLLFLGFLHHAAVVLKSLAQFRFVGFEGVFPLPNPTPLRKQIRMAAPAYTHGTLPTSPAFQAVTS